MKKVLCLLLVVMMFLMLTGCGKILTGDEVAEKLRVSNLPISNIIVYTAETDRNKLLGRPNQYIGKVAFADTRLEQVDGQAPVGGSIEIFNNTADLNARITYIENTAKNGVLLLSPYMYPNGVYLLRLSKDLTPTQVEEYKTAFMKMK